MSGVTKSIGSSALVLWLYGTVAGFLTVGIYIYTKDTIDEQERLAKVRALTQIIEADQYDNELLDDRLQLLNPAGLGLFGDAQAHIARREQQATAVILPVTVSDGYGGDMKMIVGVRANGEISGVRVLSHNETPGLGDKIDVRKDDWIHSFSGRSLGNPVIEKWGVKKDGGVFDQFTGATITPRAVVNGVLGALSYFKEHQRMLLAPLKGAEPKPAPTENSPVAAEEPDDGR